MASDEDIPRKLPNGQIEIQLRAEGPHGMVGDATTLIGPDDADYEYYDALIARRKRVRARHRAET